jgi:carboxypeptidase C (cathepsin A)
MRCYLLTVPRQAIITLPNGTCPDYAQTLGTCGTYSYANESLTANSTYDAASNFYRALQGFMGAMPQYSRSVFHFSSESYGGHYGPIFNEYIEAQNAKKLPGAQHISFETVLIGYDWTANLLFDRSSRVQQERLV